MFFICAAVKQLDPAHPLDYEGAVVHCCLSTFKEGTHTESVSEQCQHSTSVKYKKINI